MDQRNHGVGASPSIRRPAGQGGPYRLWIHEHRFRDSEHGTIYEDTVRYAVWGGALVNWMAVGRDVQRIFEYRQEKLLEIFSPDVELPFQMTRLALAPFCSL